MSPTIKAVRVKLEVNSRRDERFILLTSPLRGRDEVFLVCETSKKKKAISRVFRKNRLCDFPSIFNMLLALTRVCRKIY